MGIVDLTLQGSRRNFWGAKTCAPKIACSPFKNMKNKIWNFELQFLEMIPIETFTDFVEMFNFENLQLPPRPKCGTR